MMENIKVDLSRGIKISNLELVILIGCIPTALIPVVLLSRFAPGLYNWSYNITKGLINQTLILYLLLSFIFIYLILYKSSKFRPIDIGLKKGKLKDGIIITVILFILLQVYGVVYSYFCFGELTMNEVMYKGTIVAGYYISMIFGVAFFEEVLFRGVLIPQIFIRLKSDKSKNKIMFMALFISQALFSVMHIPIRLINGVGFTDLMISLASIFIIGIVFAFIYLLTDNLFIAIGVHALWDISQNNAATFYNSKYAFIVVGVFAFAIMYVSVVRNSKRNTNMSVKN
ncbi:CPBP family intramembrane metalloprotease [Clostridium swellfunianum]|uniref:CPBP family intramembrane glutamic endopeptidase n=1 Tax=Clostridium swellfunianum TaxID=1367462 RepID=UPI0020304705|nr:type II CAAX endopeptidase family protein [Clostridium swellfunianum]MCM0649146.1 CPBP family intramembrane metalloprotease [Clostridium swellfunianum]